MFYNSKYLPCIFYYITIKLVLDIADIGIVKVSIYV